MKLLNLFALFIIITISSSAQTANDTIQAYQYFKKADSLLTERKLDSSIVYFKKALPIYEKAEAWERVAGCYNGIAEYNKSKQQYQEMIMNAGKVLNICNRKSLENSLQEARAYTYLGLYNRLSIKNYNKALEYFQKALSIQSLKLSKTDESVANSYYDLGLTNKLLQDYDEALIHYKKSLKIRLGLFENGDRSIAELYSDMSDIFILKSNYNEALKYLNKSKTMTERVTGSNSIEMAYLYSDIGSCYYGIGLYNQALEYFQKCFSIQSSGLEKNTQKLGVTCGKIARCFIRKRSFDEALKYFKKALTLEKAYPASNTIWIGAYYNNIGIAYRHKQEYEKALEYTLKAFDTYSSILGKDHGRVANCYHSMGLIYFNQNKFEEALLYLNKSLKIRTKTIGKTHFKTANLYASIAHVYRKKKDFDNAVDNYNISLNIFVDIFEENHPWVVSIYNDIAYTHLENENYKEALRLFDKAFSLNLIEKKVKKKKKPSFEDHYDLNLLLISLEGEARVFKEIYKKSGKADHLYKSQKKYIKLNELINVLRSEYTEYDDKINFVKTIKGIYTEGIETELLLYKQTSRIKALTNMFRLAEKGKSNVLKELVNTTNAKTFSGLSNNLIELEKDLRIDKAFYRSKVNEGLSSKKIDSVKLTNYENKLFDISRRQDSLTEVLEKNYPKYHQLKYNNEVISVTDIQQKLNDNQTLLEFFTADSTTYAFTISKNKLNVKELPTPKLQENIELLRELITSKNTKAYKTKSYSLYKQLIKPLNDRIIGNQLIIVPDGPLWHLNFDLLLTQEDDSNDPKELSYLLKDYAITYANSATLLFNSFKTDKPIEKQQECLAFSFTDSTNVIETKTMDLAVLRGTDDDLPGTRKEIKAIADIIDGQYFYGSEANEKNFKKNASQYNILHLALHGEVDNDRPENSKLYFTKSKDTIEDNLLYSHELFALDIPAELTVLSACNTGTGKIATGEGIMSLGTAFQYAGTKSLLLNSWEVDDQTAPTLMKYFYTNLKEGMNKAQALQKAKLQYINTTSINRTDPFYWGGFYLVGDSSSIEFDNSNYLYRILGFGILAILLLSIFWYKRKTNI